MRDRMLRVVTHARRVKRVGKVGLTAGERKCDERFHLVTASSEASLAYLEEMHAWKGRHSVGENLSFRQKPTDKLEHCNSQKTSLSSSSQFWRFNIRDPGKLTPPLLPTEPAMPQPRHPKTPPPSSKTSSILSTPPTRAPNNSNHNYKTSPSPPSPTSSRQRAQQSPTSIPSLPPPPNWIPCAPFSHQNCFSSPKNPPHPPPLPMLNRLPPPHKPRSKP